MFAEASAGPATDLKLWVVLASGVIMLVPLVVLALRYADRTRRDRAEVKWLVDSAGGFDDLVSELAGEWLRWVRSATHDQALTPPTRDEAEREFNWRQFHQGEYALLARYPQAAPLFGLLLTALSGVLFWAFDLNALGDAPPGEVLRKVLPLLSGVGMGALVAVIGFAVLQLLGRPAGAFRNEALAWYDDAARRRFHARGDRVDQVVGAYRDLATDVQRRMQAAAVRTHEVLERLAVLTETAGRATEASVIAAAAAAGAATDAGRAATALRDEVSRLASAGAQHAIEARTLSEQAVRMASAWVDAGSAVRELATQADAVTRQFADVKQVFADRVGPAADTLAVAAERHAAAAGRLTASAVSAGESSDHLRASAVALTALNRSVADGMLPGLEAFRGVGERLEQVTSGLGERTAALEVHMQSVGDGLSAFNAATGLLSRAVTAQVLPTVDALADLPAAAGQFRLAAGQMTAAGELIDQITRQYYRQSGEFGSATTVLQDNMTAARAVLGELSAFTATAAALTTTSASLADMVGRLAPAATALAQIGDGVQSLERLTPAVDKLTRQAKRLGDTVGKAGAAADAFDRLKAAADVLTAAARSGRRRTLWDRLWGR